MCACEFVCMYMCVYTHMGQPTCRDRRTTCGSQFSFTVLFTVWIQGPNLGSSDLATIIFMWTKFNLDTNSYLLNTGQLFLLLLIFLFRFGLFLENRMSLFSSGCLRTRLVAQAGLQWKATRLPLPAQCCDWRDKTARPS